MPLNPNPKDRVDPESAAACSVDALGGCASTSGLPVLFPLPHDTPGEKKFTYTSGVPVLVLRRSALSSNFSLRDP